MADSEREPQYDVQQARLDLDNVYGKPCSHLPKRPCHGCIMDRESAYMNEYADAMLGEIARLQERIRTLYGRADTAIGNRRISQEASDTVKWVFNV